MSLWRQLKRGLRVLARREAADRDVDDEVRQYLEEATAAAIAGGLAPDEARRAARMAIGSPAAVRDEVRSSGWEDLVGTSLADLRYAARRLRKNAGFTTVAVLTLALGIGASTAIFSAVDPILFEPLPYPDAGRIAMIWPKVDDGSRAAGAAFGLYREIVQRTRALEAIAAVRAWQPTATGPNEPERLDGQRVSAAYFRALGVAPAIGRDFDASDDRPQGAKQVILADGLWRRRFGGNPAVVGRLVRLDDDSFTVAGVMPAGFENALAPSAQIWTLLQYDASQMGSWNSREWGNHLRFVARLRQGISLERARADLDGIARNPLPEFPRPPWASPDKGFIVNSLQGDLTESVRPALLAVFGAVLLLLAVACVNVTNLMLARGAQRRGEFAMRAALGASRSRMIRQLLTESLLLAAVGGAAGMLVANLGVSALLALSPHDLPRLASVHLDPRALSFAVALTALVGVLFGLIPALHGSRTDLRGALHQTSGRTAGGHQTTRRVLVVAEVALALMLLVGAGLLLRSMQRLFSIDPGFDPSGVVTMQVQTSGHRFDDDGKRRRFFTEALEAVRALPGVSAAAFTAQLPLSGDSDGYGFAIESRPEDEEGAFRYATIGDYFKAMGIALRSGRPLDAHDATGPRVVVINESLAKRKFPGVDPIGKRVRFGPGREWNTIVGVAADVKQASLALSQTDAVYVPAQQWPWADNAMWLVVRAGAAPATLVPALRKAIWSIDKDQPIVRVSGMSELLAASAAERRFAMLLFEVFGLMALVLAATGLYGVLSGSVTERARELGIRSALGASPREILALVVRQGLVLAAIGVGIGLTAAIAASRAVAGLLFDVSRMDPATYAAVVFLLLAVSAVACFVPAFRAARVDPAIALTAE